MLYVRIGFLIFFCILIASCGSTEVRKSKAYRFAGGLIYDNKSDKLFTGTVSDSSSVIMNYDVVEGKKNGSFLVYFRNGNLAQSGYIIDNKNEGEWKYYYSNGNLESSGMYKKDVAQGTWNFYYETGNLKEEGEIKDGIRYGKWTLYNEDRSVKNVFYFKNGEIAEQIRIG